MNLQNLKYDLLEARKNRDGVRANVLRLIISEFELLLNRNQKADLTNVVNKLIKSNNESLSHRDDPILRQENSILSEYLPKYLTEQEIHSHVINLEMTGNINRDLGTCMKYFKSKGLSVKSENVQNVILSKVI